MLVFVFENNAELVKVISKVSALAGVDLDAMVNRWTRDAQDFSEFCSIVRGDGPMPNILTNGSPRSEFRLEGEYWTIAHQNVVVRLRNCRSVRYFATIIRSPGREIRPLELVAGPQRAVSTSMNSGAFDDLSGRGCIADARTLADIRNRRKQLREELDDAERNNDLGRQEAIRIEIEQLEDYVRSARSFGGRSRSFATAAERARQTVTRGVWKTVERIRLGNPALAKHFKLHLRTGRLCSYCPDPQDAIAWEF